MPGRLRPGYAPRLPPQISWLSAPVAQLDRASDYGSEGLKFESSRARFSRQRWPPKQEVDALSLKSARIRTAAIIGFEDARGLAPPQTLIQEEPFSFRSF